MAGVERTHEIAFDRGVLVALSVLAADDNAHGWREVAIACGPRRLYRRAQIDGEVRSSGFTRYRDDFRRMVTRG